MWHLSLSFVDSNRHSYLPRVRHIIINSIELALVNCEAADVAVFPGPRDQFLDGLRRDLPQDQVAVSAGGQGEIAVFDKGDIPNAAGMAVKTPQHFAAAQLPEQQGTLVVAG